LAIEHEEILSVAQLFLIGRKKNFHLPTEGKSINVVGPAFASTTH
jgi:hypothetical protein